MQLADHFNVLLKDTVNLSQFKLDLLNERVEAIYKALKADAEIGALITGKTPQGSWAHRTIINPVGDNEFDADFMLDMSENREWADSPKTYIDEVYAALHRHGTYGAMPHSRKCRCVRLVYANSMHVDIVPHLNLADGREVIINRDDNQWELTNPQGFTDWMKNKDSLASSMAVRMGAWSVITSIVQRPAQIHPNDYDYVHSSWIRHGHVEAARAGLTGDAAEGGYLISVARELMVAQPATRPDVPESLVPTASNPAADDLLLNSLCQFDILYCLLVAAEGQTSVRSFYPSSAAFDESRADPALVIVAGDNTVRTTMFPNSNDGEIADAMYKVVRLAMQEAFNFGGRWWGPPPSVQAFLAQNGQQEA